MDEELGIEPPRGPETTLSALLRSFVEAVNRRYSGDTEAPIADLVQPTIAGIATWIVSVDRSNQNAIRSTFRRFFPLATRTTRVNLALAADVERFLDAAAFDNSQLITSLSQDQRLRVAEIIRNPIEGVGTEVRLRRALEIGKTRARIIARDQTASLNSALSEQRHLAAGAQEYFWSTSGDERVRPLHDSLDGTRYRYGEPTDAESGLPPGRPILCRCVAIPIFEE